MIVTHTIPYQSWLLLETVRWNLTWEATSSFSLHFLYFRGSNTVHQLPGTVVQDTVLHFITFSHLCALPQSALDRTVIIISMSQMRGTRPAQVKCSLAQAHPVCRRQSWTQDLCLLLPPPWLPLGSLWTKNWLVLSKDRLKFSRRVWWLGLISTKESGRVKTPALFQVETIQR